jgi:hypothetical protein
MTKRIKGYFIWIGIIIIIVVVIYVFVNIINHVSYEIM